MVIGTVAIDGWAVTFGTARKGLGGLPPMPLLAVPNVTAHPSTASIPTSYYLMWHVVEFYLYPTVSTALVHSVKPKLTE